MRRYYSVMIIVSLLTGSAMIYPINSVSAIETGKQQNMILENLLQYITPSGKTLQGLVMTRDTNMIGDAAYGDPEWEVKIDDSGNALITCIQTATFYTDNESPNIGGAEMLRWFFDGDNYYSVAPNLLNDGLPDIEMPEEFGPGT